MPSPLSLARLESAIAGGFSAIRSRTRLQPAGGPGDKVFPPTYATGNNPVTRYATERRRVDGADVECVLLDSVQSQANRIEEALLQAWDDHSLPFPVIAVDFGIDAELADLDRISTLHAPHRVFDALLRDSVADGVLFRDTELGRAITSATTKNATALFRACPTALVLGAWDSTGPRGGLGNKFARALVSEIVAIHAVPGTKTSSRLDPVGIQRNVDVYVHAENHNDYTIDEAEARQDRGKPVKYGKEGKPSEINHSNIAPSIDTAAGGITFDYGLQTTVLSLPALRRLRFQTSVDGRRLEGDERRRAEQSARTALAALALAGITALRDLGFDLRSRCALVPEAAFTLELVPSDGGECETFTLRSSEAFALLQEAHGKAASAGMGWTREPMRLVPAPKLAALIKKSRAVATSEPVAGDA